MPFAIDNYITDLEICQADYLDKIKERKKMHSEYIGTYAEALRQSGKSEQQIARAEICGNYIKVSDNGEIQTINTCKNRLCIICAWKLSRKVFRDTMLMLDYLKEREYKYIFLTLTVKNVPGEKLTEQINQLNAGYKRLYERKRFKAFSKGTIKNIEITYNEKKNTFHGHIHAIIAVDKDYFTTQGKYISQQEIRRLWEKSARLDYKSQVDIRKIDDDDSGAVAECSKYAVKLSNLYKVKNHEKRVSAIKTMIMATYHRRLHTLSQCFKEAAQHLDIKDYESEDDELKGVINETDKIFEWTPGINTYTETNWIETV